MLPPPSSMYCSSSSSPVGTLPVELLSYIFTLATHGPVEPSECVVDEDRGGVPFDTGSVKAPLAFSTVCRHWRRVALNTPGLWTKLCITVELIQNSCGRREGREALLDPTHLISYLALSRNYPLDILIDARDQDWDFFEPEIPSEYEVDTYTPPFSSAHMSQVVSLLVPHIYRWHSLSILTDSWAPLYTALTEINPFIACIGAPLLESLTLMRCNDFVSYAPEFQPRHLRGPAFLDYGTHSTDNSKHILPRLKHLTLRGVHVHWPSLSTLLSTSKSGLQSLEMTSHCADVRPMLAEFHALLNANPFLQKLVITGSGPDVPSDVDDIIDVIHHNLEPVHLPQLHEISLGYRSALEGQAILELVDAPNAKILTLEDSTYPADPEPVDAGSLLSYIGTGEFRDPDQKYLVAYELPDGLHYQVAMRSEQRQRTRRRGSDEEEEVGSRAVFPLLESVTLNDVKACPRPLHAFFNGLPNVKTLEVKGMPPQALHSLLPSSSGRASPASGPALRCPCPQLQRLSLRGLENVQKEDVEFVVGSLSFSRQSSGACAVREVDFHIERIAEEDVEDIVNCSCAPPETTVRIHVELGSEEMDVDEDMDCALFDDPVFDSYYSLV